MYSYRQRIERDDDLALNLFSLFAEEAYDDNILFVTAGKLRELLVDEACKDTDQVKELGNERE